VRATLEERHLRDAPMYIVSSNTHSLVNLLSGDALLHEDRIVGWLDEAGPRTCARSSTSSARAAPRARGRTSCTSPRATTTTR
jgi:hypothetical protein